MGIAGSALAIVRMTGQMPFMRIRCVVMYQFVFTVIVRFVTAAAGAVVVPMVVIMTVRMFVTVIV